jgi:hypothetical protein
VNKLICMLLSCGCCAWAALCEAGVPSPNVHELLQQAVAGGWRSEPTRPATSTAIRSKRWSSCLEPDMTVVEPRQGGWFTEIPAPVLATMASSSLPASSPATTPGNFEHPDVFGKVKPCSLHPEHVEMAWTASRHGADVP